MPGGGGRLILVLANTGPPAHLAGVRSALSIEAGSGKGTVVER
jgi:hypothetical protein